MSNKVQHPKKKIFAEIREDIWNALEYHSERYGITKTHIIEQGIKKELNLPDDVENVK